MATDTEKAPPRRYGMGKVYLNAVSAVLSFLLALMLLQEHIEFLLYYLLFAIIMAAVSFKLRIRLSFIRTPEPTQEDLLETKKWTHRWKTPLLILAMIFAVFTLPLFLAWVLDPYVWFVLVVGFITGLSASEVLFYLYIRRAQKNLG